MYETTQALSVGEVNFDKSDLERSKIALASCGRPPLPYLSSCYCVLHFPTVLCGRGHHEIVEGHSKKISFRKLCPSAIKLLPAPLTGSHCCGPICDETQNGS